METGVFVDCVCEWLVIILFVMGIKRGGKIELFILLITGVEG
jgi:hypothetical protein